jgi:hypothetical protein
MYWLINRGEANHERRATLAFISRFAVHAARWAPLFAIVFLTGCTQQTSRSPKSFYDIDSLVALQIETLKNAGYELNKSVEIDGQKEQITFVPDSLQWVHELDVFRQLDQVNKASFRDAYVVTDRRDINSNLMVREVKANRPVPVSLVRFYYLRTPEDLRKIEATWTEENTLYVNTRTMTMELERFNDVHLVHRYRVEGFQKMVMSDSVHFVISGEVGM